MTMCGTESLFANCTTGLFDRGLFSLSETYRIIVSGLMSDQRPTEWMLTELQDKSIRLPDRDQLYPAQDAMAWHRKKMLRE